MTDQLYTSLRYVGKWFHRLVPLVLEPPRPSLASHPWRWHPTHENASGILVRERAPPVLAIYNHSS